MTPEELLRKEAKGRDGPLLLRARKRENHIGDKPAK